MSTLFFPIAGVSEPVKYQVPTGLCVGIPWQDSPVTGEHARLLHAKSFYDWGWAGAERHELLWTGFWNPNQSRYYWDKVKEWMKNGRTPITWNEPDGFGISPQEAAYYMREWDAPFIGFGNIICDPGSIVNGASLPGTQWIDRYYDFDGPKPLAYHIHLYPFGEVVREKYHYATDIWKYIRDLFLEWNQERGGNLPVLVSETNANTREVKDQKAILDECYHSIKDRSLTAVYWYCARWLMGEPDWEREWRNCWLLDENLQLTDLGRHFQELALDVNGQ